MNQFLVLAGEDCYPGGWDDFRGAYTTLDEAIARARSSGEDWWEVIDTDCEEVVAEGRRDRPAAQHQPQFVGPPEPTAMDRALEAVSQFNAHAVRAIVGERKGDAQ